MIPFGKVTTEPGMRLELFIYLSLPNTPEFDRSINTAA